MVTESELMDIVENSNIIKGKWTMEFDVSFIDQGIDSMDIATLLHKIEMNWSVVIEPEQVLEMKCLRDVLNFLNCRE
jgi:acyl carrier protein